MRNGLTDILVVNERTIGEAKTTIANACPEAFNGPVVKQAATILLEAARTGLVEARPWQTVTQEGISIVFPSTIVVESGNKPVVIVPYQVELKQK